MWQHTRDPKEILAVAKQNASESGAAVACTSGCCGDGSGGGSSTAGGCAGGADTGSSCGGGCGGGSASSGASDAQSGSGCGGGDVEVKEHRATHGTGWMLRRITGRLSGGQSRDERVAWTTSPRRTQAGFLQPNPNGDEV